MPVSLPPLILASASPRRRSLLQEHGYLFSVQSAEVEEISPPHLTPAETVLYNARLKALDIARHHPEALVLGADTVVAFESEIFGKPADLAAAETMLHRLNGQTHEVFSGVWLVQSAAKRQQGFVEITRVHFHRLGIKQLRAYLARIGPLDKAGAYAAQDDRGDLIKSVEGSFTNVVGLPMERLRQVLSAWHTEKRQRV